MLLLAITFFATSQEGFGQSCPTGYNTRTITVNIATPPSPPCFVELTYCWKCSITGPNPSSLIITKFVILSTGNSNCNFLSITDRTIKDLAISDWMSLCNQPPCGSPQAKKLKVEMASCVKAKNEYYTYEINGQQYSGYVTFMQFCDSEAKCIEEWNICIDYSVNPPAVVKQLLSKSQVGTPNCQLNQPPMPPIGKTWTEEWETVCWSLPCE